MMDVGNLDLWGYLILISAFLGLFGLIEFTLLLVGNRKAVAHSKRFKFRFNSLMDGMPAPEKGWIKKGAYAKSPELDAWLKQFPRLEFLYLLIGTTGRKITVAQVLVTTVAMGILGLVVGIILKLGIFTPLLGMVGGAIPLGILRYWRKQRMAKIEEQLPDALDTLAQSLRAGHAFSGAFRMVAQQSPEPIATEFRITSDEVTFGASVREGVLGLAQRVELVDMRYFALTVLIQLDTGGSLSQLLIDLARLMRERHKLRRTIRVLSAEGRVSAWILSLLPLGFGLLMSLISPGYLSYFWTDPMGIILTKVMAGQFILGVVWMRSITQIKV